MIDSLNNMECKRTQFNDKHAKISEEICKGKEHMEKSSQNRRPSLLRQAVKQRLQE